MIILIAESKNMTGKLSPLAGCGCNPAIAPASLSPVFCCEADAIAARFAAMSVAEISERVYLSARLAMKARQLFLEFGDKSQGCLALSAFTGEVFRALDAATLPSDALEFASTRLFIVSSLYGLLRTADIIRPYRFDYDVEYEGEKMQRFWKEKVTGLITEILQERSETEILDLLPAEAAKCIDWKPITQHARVVKAGFSIIGDSGKFRQPHSGKLKELRGRLLRYILTKHTDSLQETASSSTPLFAPDDAEIFTTSSMKMNFLAIP